MKVLILDDDDFRHKFFTNVYRNHDVHNVKTYGEFIAVLRHTSPFDVVHLDHDLGDEEKFFDTYGEPRAYTGYHAALAICDLSNELLPGKVLIHSVNPVGARLMLTCLTARRVKASWQPFGNSMQGVL